MAKKINVNNILAGLNEVAARTEEFAIMSKSQSISIKEIILNPDNTAAEDDTPESIKELADSIALTGLIHPLTVNRIGEHKYMLLSGERRFKAITTHLNWESVQCTVYDNLDPAMATVATVEANMETRQYTIPQRLKLYQQLDEALHSLKERGLFKGGISQEIAKRMNVNKAQISKYKTIIENMSGDEISQIRTINEAVEMVRMQKKLPEATFPEETKGTEEKTCTKENKKLPEATFSEPPKRQKPESDVDSLPTINLDTLLDADAARFQLRECIGWDGRCLNSSNDLDTVREKINGIITAYNELCSYLQEHSTIIVPKKSELK